MTDREATQKYTILYILSNHVGELLSVEKINQISQEINREMTEGSTSWAFKEIEQ